LAAVDACFTVHIVHFRPHCCCYIPCFDSACSTANSKYIYLCMEPKLDFKKII